jgi:sec-independent protein translocase protein TatC
MDEKKKDKQDATQSEEEELASMSLGDHLDELRYRLVRAVGGLMLGVIVSLFFGKYFFELLMFPYDWAMKNAGLKPQMLALKPMEQFIIYLKICMVAGLVFSSFWVFYQLWAFVSAGLYRHERRMVKLAAPASASLFIFGSVFFLLVVAPMMMQFCVSFNVGVQYVQPGVYQLSDYTSLILLLMLVFGLAFQMPIALIFAERMGLITIAQLSTFRKYAILVIVVVAAIVTPSPDVVSQLALAIPLYMLYEISIIVCRVIRKRADRKKAAESAG